MMCVGFKKSFKYYLNKKSIDSRIFELFMKDLTKKMAESDPFFIKTTIIFVDNV